MKTDFLAFIATDRVLLAHQEILIIPCTIFVPHPFSFRACARMRDCIISSPYQPPIALTYSSFPDDGVCIDVETLELISISTLIVKASESNKCQKILYLFWSIFNPLCMYEGYGSHSVCVCVCARLLPWC